MHTYEREITNFNNRRTQQENWSWFPCVLFFRPYSSLHRPNDHQRPRRSGWPKWSFSENRVFVQAWFPVTARMIPKLGGWEVSVKWPKRLKKTLRSSKYNLQEKIWVRLFSLEIILCFKFRNCLHYQQNHGVIYKIKFWIEEELKLSAKTLLINNSVYTYLTQGQELVVFPMDYAPGRMLKMVMILTGHVMMGVHQVKIQDLVTTARPRMGLVSWYRPKLWHGLFSEHLHFACHKTEVITNWSPGRRDRGGLLQTEKLNSTYYNGDKWSNLMLK